MSISFLIHSNLTLYRAIQGDVFTFLIGPDLQRFEIHSSLVSRYSKPLERMMNNVVMNESLDRAAVLNDIEPETFIHFAEFCYKGNYWCALRPINFHFERESVVNLARRLSSTKLSHYYCHYCGEGPFEIPGNRQFPRCSSSCYSDKTRCVICCSLNSVRTADPRICRGCSTNYGLNLPVQTTVSNDLWQDFKKKRLGCMGMNYHEVKEYLDRCTPKDEPTDALLSHARLFVFADRYDIQPLEELSIHKLHRDLVSFKLLPENIPELVALLEFTYANTMESDDDQENWQFTTTECRLKDLVIQYLVCNAELLQHLREFRNFLCKGGKIVDDYTCGLTKRLR